MNLSHLDRYPDGHGLETHDADWWEYQWEKEHERDEKYCSLDRDEEPLSTVHEWSEAIAASHDLAPVGKPIRWERVGRRPMVESDPEWVFPHLRGVSVPVSRPVFAMRCRACGAGEGDVGHRECDGGKNRESKLVETFIACFDSWVETGCRMENT